MSYDIFAEWAGNRARLEDIPEVYTRIKYLLTRDPRDARRAYQNLVKDYRLGLENLDQPSSACLEIMPQLSFFMTFRFTLALPWLSRDDDEFYIGENPIRKDKVFKVPMISGSTWKGNMRRTAGTILERECENDPAGFLKRRMQLINLFGQENEAQKAYFDSLIDEETLREFETQLKNCINKDGIRKGRLNFFPTFFNWIGLEVINPHNRETKAGTLPVFIESVPQGSTGNFSLLYVPFDLMGKPQVAAKVEVTEDLDVVYNSLAEMMLKYGFSAKKSSGFGVIEEKIEGSFEMSGAELYKKEPGSKSGKRKSGSLSDLRKLLEADESGSEKDNSFSSFGDLRSLLDRIKEAIARDVKKTQ